MPIGEPDFILYAQHGWADNHQAIAALAESVAAEKTEIIAPELRSNLAPNRNAGSDS